MNRKFILLAVFTCGFFNYMPAQTLFTYGQKSVDAKDFMRAYKKNNTADTKNKAQSISNYLDLYIKSKLKVQEAYTRGYDTLPSIRMEVENLRSQIAENYMTDPEIMNRLEKEAFQRSQKDIHVAHIFIAFKNASGFIDTIAAQKKRDDVLNKLKNGADFLQTAQAFSDDPAVVSNSGDLGFITVFTLPYDFENVVYTTPVGKFSLVLRSKIGYHIFKNMGERKAAGKMKAQQILLAFPPASSDAAKQQIGNLADSIYKRLLAGDKFEDFVHQYSNDYVSAANNGTMPDIGVGKYDPAFEKALWALKKDGELARPVQTSHGWHLLKRVGIKPIPSDFSNKEYKQEIEQKVMADSRWKASRDYVYDQVKAKAGVRFFPYDNAGLWSYSDSLIDKKPLTAAGKKIVPTTSLFSIGSTTYNAEAWITYANVYRYRPDGTGAKPYEQVMQDWMNREMFDYYKNHLEDFNEEFRNQMAEFKDGNLFFEIMQQEVWNKAQMDTTALKDIYAANKKKYTWQKSADVVIFFCSDDAIAKTIFDKVKANPSDWKRTVDMYSEKVLADSSRYEWSQIPNLNKMVPTAGMVTTPVTNTTDNTASFAYIINVYPTVSQRSFEEAKGLVINDYQTGLELQFDKKLREKYPVSIDQKVLAQLSK